MKIGSFTKIKIDRPRRPYVKRPVNRCHTIADKNVYIPENISYKENLYFNNCKESEIIEKDITVKSIAWYLNITGDSRFVK